MPDLILASGSKARAALLTNAGLTFDKIPADLDEDAIKDEGLLKGLSPKAVAIRLAEAKAGHIGKSHKELILAADQVLQLGKDLISKSASRAEAKDLLHRMSGRSHYLHSAIALVENGRLLWSHAETAEMTVRSLSEAYIEAYLDEVGDTVLSSVGCYHLEGAGVHLFDTIQGDYFTVLGLPMLPLLAKLRNLKVIK